MSLRDVPIVKPATNVSLEMARVVITEDTIFCVWRIRAPSGITEARVEVSPGLVNNLFGRTPFQTMLDNLAADTSPRVPS
jgi:hypothetical protein